MGRVVWCGRVWCVRCVGRVCGAGGVVWCGVVWCVWCVGRVCGWCGVLCVGRVCGWCGVLCVGGVGGGRVGHLSDGDGHSEFLLAGHGSDGRLLVLWDSEGEEGEQEGGGG